MENIFITLKVLLGPKSIQFLVIFISAAVIHSLEKRKVMGCEYHVKAGGVIKSFTVAYLFSFICISIFVFLRKRSQSCENCSDILGFMEDRKNIFVEVVIDVFSMFIFAYLACHFSGLKVKDFGLFSKKISLKEAISIFIGVAFVILLRFLQSKYSVPHDDKYNFSKNIFGVRNIYNLSSSIEGVRLFVSVLITPVVEEILYRGVYFFAFRRLLGDFSAVILSAAVFAAMHVNPAAMGGAFLLGLVFGWVYKSTNIILFPMLLHILANVLVVI